MFKRANFEEEIYQSMEKQLVSNQLERQYGFSKLALAAEYLNKAASIFEAADMSDIAEDITQTLDGLSNYLQGDK